MRLIHCSAPLAIVERGPLPASASLPLVKALPACLPSCLQPSQASSQSVSPKMASAAAARVTSATSPPTTPPVKRARIAAVADTENGSRKSPDPEGWTEAVQVAGEAAARDHIVRGVSPRTGKYKMAAALFCLGFFN